MRSARLAIPGEIQPRAGRRQKRSRELPLQGQAGAEEPVRHRDLRSHARRRILQVSFGNLRALYLHSEDTRRISFESQVSIKTVIKKIVRARFQAAKQEGESRGAVEVLLLTAVDGEARARPIRARTSAGRVQGRQRSGRGRRARRQRRVLAARLHPGFLLPNQVRDDDAAVARQQSRRDPEMSGLTVLLCCR